MILHDVLYWTVNGEPNDIQSIDPDGGPYIGIGTKFGNWKISRITFVSKEDDDNEGCDPSTLVVYGWATTSGY